MSWELLIPTPLINILSLFLNSVVLFWTFQIALLFLCYFKCKVKDFLDLRPKKDTLETNFTSECSIFVSWFSFFNFAKMFNSLSFSCLSLSLYFFFFFLPNAPNLQDHMRDFSTIIFPWTVSPFLFSSFLLSVVSGKARRSG